MVHHVAASMVHVTASMVHVTNLTPGSANPSRGTNGTAFFTFTEPDVFEANEMSGEITGKETD
jgi:hypothetical protein